MADIKFGTGQLSNPTPSAVNWWVRLISIVAGTFGGWMMTIDFIGPKSKNILYGIITLVIGLANAIGPLFGVEVKGKVDAEDVTAIDKP